MWYRTSKSDIEIITLEEVSPRPLDIANIIASLKTLHPSINVYELRDRAALEITFNYADLSPDYRAATALDRAWEVNR